MTIYPEYRVKCNRCGFEEHTPIESTSAPHTRAAGPEGWTVLTVGVDPSTPLSHLCPPCTERFSLFIAKML